MKRRILTIVLAIVLAVIGTGAVLIYVKQADVRAIAGQKAVTVLVATQQIPVGTTLGDAQSNGLLSSQKLPASSVPSDAVRSITPALAGLVLSADVASGQLLLRPMLVTAVQATTGFSIPTGMVAVTLQFCLQKAVASYVRAGSHVAVFNTFFTGPQGSVQWSCSGTTIQKGITAIHTRLVLPKVQVLAVGPASPATPGAAPATSTAFTQSTATTSNATIVLVTMAVDQRDAERLIKLAESGIPYLALVTDSSGTKSDITYQP